MAPKPRVFLDFAVAEKPLGRVVFELFRDVVPKTAENFRALCTGERGLSKTSSVPLHYKNSIVHRIIDGFMIQGGDFTKRTGAGGESIYGGTFDDERLEGDGTEVDKKGLLVMANRGPNTNGSQWFITLAAAPHLTGKHVVFGRVVHGLEHVEHLGHLPTDEKDRPLSPVTIVHCGELELRRPPPKKARSPSPVESQTSDRSASLRRRKSKRDTDSDDSDDSYTRERRRRKERKREKKERRKEKERSKPREETEEELDARLEREEKERLELKRLEKLAEMKQQLEDERQRIKDAGGVVYKGRGSMRYLDPESTHRSMPRNFDSRGPDVRPRAPAPSAPRHSDRDRGDRFDRDRGKREREDRGRDRGEDARRDRLDRDMDRWRHDRAQDQGDKFTRARDEPLLGESRNRSRSRSRSPPTNGGGVLSATRVRSQSPVRGRTQSRSPARSDGSEDMVLEDD